MRMNVGNFSSCPETLKSLGECIARNCEGSPLAISVVASSLVIPPLTDLTKDLTEKLWKKVSENVTMYVTEYGARHDLFKRLELSYTQLPPLLQNCFLYLGMFPEGHEIPVSTLTRLWIAEELIIDESDGTNLEKMAEQNLYDLVDRNLVMVGKTYPNGKIKTCRLHKVIYGFCKYKGGEQEFYQEIRMSRGGSLDSLTPNRRRLCINSRLSEFLSIRPKGPSVRSVLCLNKEDKVLHPKHCSRIHKSFKSLKILECRCIKFAKFPSKLSTLLSLKYISLSCDDLDAIPETISSLHFLETLVLETQSPSLDCKANVWEMLNLRHFLSKAAIVLAVRQQGTATDEAKYLQTLTRLAPECCTEDALTRARKLKTLGIRGSLAALSSPKSLTKMFHLEYLKLINESASVSRLDHLLQTNCFPQNLKRLTLSATHMEWDSMSILGSMHSLEILKLKNNAFAGGYWNADANGFLSLGFLFIGTTDLISWEASARCFPELKCLVLKNCEKLEKIPLILGKSLDTLDVENLSESAVQSAKEIEEEHKSRSHKFKLFIRE